MAERRLWGNGGRRDKLCKIQGGGVAGVAKILTNGGGGGGGGGNNYLIFKR